QRGPDAAPRQNTGPGALTPRKGSVAIVDPPPVAVTPVPPTVIVTPPIITVPINPRPPYGHNPKPPTGNDPKPTTGNDPKPPTGGDGGGRPKPPYDGPKVTGTGTVKTTGSDNSGATILRERTANGPAIKLNTNVPTTHAS